MQNVYNKYKEFEINLVVYTDNLLPIEQEFLDEDWGKSKCMNLAKNAESPTKDLKYSDEAKQKISESLKGNRNALDHTIYEWKHRTGVIIRDTQYNMRRAYSMGQNVSGLINGRHKSCKGWRLISNVS